MGNGPTLNQYPDDFLMSRPRFAVNYFPHWHETVRPTFWTCWDTSPLVDMLPVVLNGGVTAIINPKDQPFFQKKGIELPDVYWWKNLEKHKGFGFNPSGGVTYTSSIHWAAQIALFLLGFTTLWVVGFDCSTASGTYQGKGIGALPHFYDEKGTGTTIRRQAKWDTQWDDMIKKYKRENRNWKIVNLSVGSRAEVFKAEDWRPHYAKV